MEDKKKVWRAIEIKPKERAEAERLFFQYCYPASPFWRWEPRKQAALDMLSSGIFGDNELKGHAKRKTTYSVSLGNLITDLVNTHFEYALDPPASYLNQEIIDTFNHHFSFVYEIATLAEVNNNLIKDCWDSWQKKISKAVDAGKISPQWRMLIEEKRLGVLCTPPKIAYRFADTLLDYVSEAHPFTIAKWANVILESLRMRESICKSSSLRDYVKRRKEERSQNPE